MVDIFEFAKRKWAQFKREIDDKTQLTTAERRALLEIISDDVETAISVDAESEDSDADEEHDHDGE